MAVRPFVAAAAVALAMTLGACQDSAMLGGASTRSLTPIPPQTLALMQTKGMSQSRWGSRAMTVAARCSP